MLDRGYESNTSRNYSDAQSTVKQQLYQIKLLSSDNQIKTQQLDILKEKIRELEDNNTIYKKQVANMESKLKLYDQELKLKVQSNEDKTVKLSQNNQYLYKKTQQYQVRMKELEDKSRNAEQELSRKAKEAETLQRRLAEIEEEFETVDKKKKRKDEELEKLSEAQRSLTAENKELNYSVTELTHENERLKRIVEDSEAQLKKLTNIQQQYSELRLSYDTEFAESKALKQSYELLKQKYDDVYYNYNIAMLNQREEESESENAKATIIDLEQELQHLQNILMQKDKESSLLNEAIRDLEHHIKDVDIRFETEIKRVVNLIDGQTTSYDFGDHNESVAMHLLIENIIRQNKEIIRLAERFKGLSQDTKELRMNVGRLTDEKNSLKSGNDELLKEIEMLKGRLQATVNESDQNINLAQASFEERLQDMVHRQRESEDRFNEQLQQKESEIIYYQELLNSTKEKLKKVEEDRDNTVEFLKEQEFEIKEFKSRFFEIAEETSNQKNKLNITSYVFASLVKVFYNLLSKFDGLVQQKAFLSPYFYQYEKIRQKLTDLQLIAPRVNPHGSNARIYERFRRVVLTVIAGIRLRRLQIKNGGVKYDSFDVRHNLANCSEGMKRFIIDLFRSNKFTLNKDLINSVEDVLKSLGNENESAIATRIIVAASYINALPYEPEDNIRKRKTKDLQLDDLTASFQIKEDFHTRLQTMDMKLQSAEEYILKQEDRFSREIDALDEKLQRAREENEGYKREKERIHTDHLIAKEQIDALLSIVDERQALISESERRDRNLNEDYNILQDCVLNIVRKYDIARKELEEKDLRLIELERQVIQAGNEENHVIYNNPVYNISRDKPGKVAGRIVSSGRKRNINEI